MTQADFPTTFASPPVLLLVDDDPGNLRLLAGLLGDSYELRLATRAEAALQIAASQHPDLILMDVMLPGMSGLEACRRLAQDPGTMDIPVIFITGGSSEDDELACWDAGGVDFVSKPVHPVTLARRVAVHIKLKQQADRLRELAGTDALTGLANRRTFDSHASREWRRCRRLHLPLSLAILDVDWFKAFNDHYGHAGGDRALRLLADTLRRLCTRAGDTVARLGGEEFALLMPNTNAEGARTLLGRLLEAVDSLQEPHAASPLGQLSISAGIASVEPETGGDLASLMALADRRLYLAKAAGRARWVDAG
ncbi:MAG: diguanylate cyclase response regulator [Arenimonas sp.]|nr:diguanylate cyclase response regulator [Arenimonas sp.]